MLLLLFAVGMMAASCDSDAPTGSTEPEILVLDVRVHLLQDPDSPAATTTLTAEEVQELFRRVNEVWGQGRIEWRIESIVTEGARNGEAFQRMVDGLAPPDPRVFAEVIPRENLTQDIWHVFFIRELGIPVGGIYFPSLPAVLQPETDPFGARGLEGALVRIVAHELGHGVSLPHVPCSPEGNLMAPGCIQGDRTRLGEAQVEEARAQARQGPYRGGSPSF